MTAANGPKSFLENNGIPLAKQSSNADSSRAGQFYNGVGYAGFSSAYGTLTFGRQNSLELDGVIAYDPMGASYAFSVIGWQGTAVGGGDTEDARISTAMKYRVDVATTGSAWEPSIRSAATRTTTARRANGEPRSARTSTSALMASSRSMPSTPKTRAP